MSIRDGTENDILSCLQVIIYAYLMEQKGLPVQRGEFRYIRLGETVGCKYDEEMKHRLHDMLQEFRTALETGDFPANGEENDACKYCKYSGICNRT